MNKIREILEELNPDFTGLADFIEENISKLNIEAPGKSESLYSEKDTFLITYADQFIAKNQTPLQALNSFANDDLEGLVNIVHILPFYPWTSDDGFSPIDYKEVEETYGSWQDIEDFPQKLMVDCVFNHVSSENPYFQQALAGDKKCEAMFHVVDKETYESQDFQENVNKVVRPRTSPLFTPYSFNGVEKYVWTTFSADQIDTNMENVDMLKYILESFFLYIDKGANYLRVDAVPFFWKELGTNCSHLTKTHKVVQLFRAICDEIKRDLYIVTESNVPHQENVTYWGDSTNEAHIIYNFSLAPLLLHGLVNETSAYLNDWAAHVFDIHPDTTFLNFTATHDGIGMRGLEGIVPEKDVEELCQLALKNGGQVGKKRSRDGSEKPYELNITWASIMHDDGLDEETNLRKLVNSQALVMFLPGIGAHYAHNFFGSFNWQEGFEESGIARRLNRQKLPYPLKLSGRSQKIKSALLKLIELKSQSRLFSPQAGFNILPHHPECFAFERFLEDERVSVFFNLSPRALVIQGKQLLPYELKITEGL